MDELSVARVMQRLIASHKDEMTGCAIYIYEQIKLNAF